MRILILPAGFAVFVGASAFAVAATNAIDHKYELEIESLLVCIVGGFVTVNFSKYHHRFCEVLNASGPYIFIPFFTLVGSSLNLKIFIQSIGFAVILFILRALCIFIGTFFCGWLVKQDPKVNKFMWLTLLPQGGFSFGVAAQVAAIFPGWGSQLQALIVSCVIVNQLIGPIFCKRAMVWADEAGKSSGNEAHEEAAADPDARMADASGILGDREHALSVEVKLSEIESVLTPMEGRRGLQSHGSLHWDSRSNLAMGPTMGFPYHENKKPWLDHSKPLEPPSLKRENFSV